LIFGGRMRSRRLWGFFMRPVLPFAMEFLLLTPLVLGMDIPEMAPLYLFLSPWLFFVLGVLNLPFLTQLFRLFRMDIRTRRNHALEHATIHFLSAARLTGIGGRAAQTGFRISGGASPVAIRAAFDHVRELIETQRPLPYVSRHCGSNRVTAMGLGILLLFVVVAISYLARPPLWSRALSLVGVVLVFAAMRHAIGNWIQARLFMATDFADAFVRSIRKVKADDVERPPVYFVETKLVEMEAGASTQGMHRPPVKANWHG
jgi:uncharacterized protein DUF6391